MNFIYDNPLARMYGPFFCLFYFLSYVAGFIFLWFYAPKLAANTKYVEPDKPAFDPDPYELAYIRDAERGVIMLCIYNLIRRKFITLLTGAHKRSIRIRQREPEANYGILNEYEKVVYTELTQEIQLVTFVEHFGLNKAMQHACKNMKIKLESNGLIWSEENKTRYIVIKIVTLVFLALIGLYKFVAATHNGHKNIEFIFFIGIFCSVFLLSVRTRGLQTKAGKVYLDKIKSVYNPIRGEQLTNSGEQLQSLLLGLYGFELLLSSSLGYMYNYINDRFTTPFFSYIPETKSGGSGSGCGSGGCGGSCGGGCGGGCGGCS